MSQLSEQTDLSTDSYTMDASASVPTKSNLTMDKKKMLGISAATLLLGGSAWAISQKIVGTKKDASTNESTSTDVSPSVTLPDDIDVAGKTTDSMTFEQAFEAARKEVGMGGVFSWHGHWYNTFEKEEWSSLSLTQRQEYTELITGEHLPVKPYVQPAVQAPSTPTIPNTASEPTVIEGHLNGQRIMGLDFDRDGVIDTLVFDGADGNTYRVVDASGDDGLDTVYRYDSLDGELTAAIRLDHPIVLSNDQFNQGLEESMSKEIVASILESDASPSTVSAVAHEDVDLDEPTNSHENHAVDSYDDDDTYINDGNVQDMDE